MSHNNNIFTKSFTSEERFELLKILCWVESPFDAVVATTINGEISFQHLELSFNRSVKFQNEISPATAAPKAAVQHSMKFLHIFSFLYCMTIDNVA